MSLTWFITIPEIRERLRKEFAMPKVAIKKEIVAPPLTTQYSETGTAFDYLLRFYIEKHNPTAVSREWIAETALNHLLDGRKKREGSGKSVDYFEKEIKGVQKVIRRARRDLNTYLVSKTLRMSDRLLGSATLLAPIDGIYRGVAHYPGAPKTKIDKNEVADLRNLINVVNPDKFHASKVCLLNPTFGETARLIGGADADLLIDDMIIDIKTTKHLQFLRRDFDQLLGYYILNKIDGMNGITPKPKVRKVAIYFSRFAYLHVYELNKIINRDTLPIFIDWFAGKAKKCYEEVQEAKEERAKQFRIEFEKAQKEQEERKQFFIRHRQELQSVRSRKSKQNDNYNR